MSIPALTRIEAEMAREVCERFVMDGEIVALALPEMTPGAYVQTLLSEGFYSESVHFLCHGLIKRDAIRWAHQCVASMEEAGAEPEVATALGLVSEWLELDDDEANEERQGQLRVSANEAAEALDLETASAWLASAVYKTLPPEDAEEDDEPGDPETQSHAAMAILLAVSDVDQSFVEDQSEQYLGNLQEFLARGVDLAAGGPGTPDRETLAFYFPETPNAGEIKIGAEIDED